MTKIQTIIFSAATISIVTCGCASIPKFDTALVAHYKMNGNATDSSPFKNNGMGYNVSYVADRNGNENAACSFSGRAAFIEVPSSESLHLTNGLSIAVWVNIKGYQNNWAAIVCKGESRSTREYAFNLSRLVNGYYMDENHDKYRDCIGTKVSKYPPNGEWHHIAIVYDLSTTIAYLDGVEVGRSESKDYFNKKGQFPLYIGKDPPGAVEFFKGEMDDLRIYNRPISVDEVKKAMSDS